jgi:hypothetical protein
LWQKSIGSDLVQFDHEYHIRGWLQKVNRPFKGGKALPSCQTPEQHPKDNNEEPADSASNPVFVNEMTVMELLRRRFDLRIEILDGEQDCIQVNRPPLNY